MIQKLWLQFQVFSRENWWIYAILWLTISVVIYSGKWNFIEILILFFINLLWAMCNMLMMSSYNNKKFAEGSIFIVSANILYTFLSLYAWFENGDIQYLLWQTSFLLTGFKAYMLYSFNRDLGYINFLSIFLLNSCVLYTLVFYIWITFPVFIQCIWIFLITLWLSLVHDTQRYFVILMWNLWVVSGTLFLFIENYLFWSILGVTVAYMLLWLSTFVYYLKLLPAYIYRYKNS